MAKDIKADKMMDSKGLACPMPMVKVSKGIIKFYIKRKV